MGSKETLTSNETLPEEAWPTQVTQTEPRKLELDFEQGELIGINGENIIRLRLFRNFRKSHSLMALEGIFMWVIQLLALRVVLAFEAAAMIIIKAHHTLEKHTLSKMAVELERSVIKFLRQLAS